MNHASTTLTKPSRRPPGTSRQGPDTPSRNGAASAVLPNTPVFRRAWARYSDLITEMDHWAGGLLEQLDEDGLAESTMVVFWGDHGPGMPRAKRWPNARAWGLEHLGSADLMVRALEAGIDQFGGESCPQLLVELVRSGRVLESRLDASARRLLREKFVPGLFDQRLVDVEAAESLVGTPAALATGRHAQSAAMTVLKNAKNPDSAPVLPLT